MLNRTFTPFPILTTERLALRKLGMNDEQEILMLRSDSEVNKYLDRQLANNIDDARNFITIINENIAKNNSLYWAITFSSLDKLVGAICLFGFSGENDTCEIGYELLPDFQGQGIMKEAVEKVIGYAFNTIKVEKIEAVFHCDNRRSQKLLEKCAFKCANETSEANADLTCYCLESQAAVF